MCLQLGDRKKKELILPVDLIAQEIMENQPDHQRLDVMLICLWTVMHCFWIILYLIYIC